MVPDDPADPSGRRRRSWPAPLAAAALVAAGATGRRILTGSSDPSAILEWDVAAGTSRSITLGQQGATYTKPDGKALLTTDTSGGTMRVQRRGLDGSVQVTYPADTGLARMSPDGLDLVAGTTTGLAVYGNATGTLVRTLPAPSGYGSCQVVSWWPDGRALTLCALGGNGVANLWLYRLDGSAPSALTAAAAGSATPFGYRGRLAGQHRDPRPGGRRLRRRTAGHADLAGDVTADHLHPSRVSGLHAPRPRPGGGGG